MGLDTLISVFLMLNFKPAFSLSSFTFIKRLFSSSYWYVLSTTEFSVSNWLITKLLHFPHASLHWCSFFLRLNTLIFFLHFFLFIINMLWSLILYKWFQMYSSVFLYQYFIFMTFPFIYSLIDFSLLYSIMLNEYNLPQFILPSLLNI